MEHRECRPTRICLYPPLPIATTRGQHATQTRQAGQTHVYSPSKWVMPGGPDGKPHILNLRRCWLSFSATPLTMIDGRTHEWENFEPDSKGRGLYTAHTDGTAR